MAEFPEDICRLVNQMVPWDRHHRSPVAQIVKGREFQAKRNNICKEWSYYFEVFLWRDYLEYYLTPHEWTVNFENDDVMCQDTHIIPPDVLIYIYGRTDYMMLNIRVGRDRWEFINEIRFGRFIDEFEPFDTNNIELTAEDEEDEEEEDEEDNSQEGMDPN